MGTKAMRGTCETCARENVVLYDQGNGLQCFRCVTAEPVATELTVAVEVEQSVAEAPVEVAVAAPVEKPTKRGQRYVITEPSGLMIGTAECGQRYTSLDKYAVQFNDRESAMKYMQLVGLFDNCYSIKALTA